MSEEKNELKSKKIEAQNQLNIGEISTLSADYVKVLTDNDLKLCTFVFFQKHPVPKLTQNGIEMEGTNDTPILEIKIPYSTSFALTMYMEMIRQQLLKDPNMRGMSWGPTSIKQGKD